MILMVFIGGFWVAVPCSILALCQLFRGHLQAINFLTLYFIPELGGSMFLQNIEI
jgi:hypothetical protein